MDQGFSEICWQRNGGRQYSHICCKSSRVRANSTTERQLLQARRNVPVRYNRDEVAKTLAAMKRIEEIRVKREREFYKKRMAGNKERQKEADRKLVAEFDHLLPKMRASERAALEAENGEVEEVPLERQETKVFGKMKERRKVLVDGGVEDEMDMD